MDDIKKKRRVWGKLMLKKMMKKSVLLCGRDSLINWIVLRLEFTHCMKLQKCLTLKFYEHQGCCLFLKALLWYIRNVTKPIDFIIDSCTKPHETKVLWLFNCSLPHSFVLVLVIAANVLAWTQIVHRCKCGFCLLSHFQRDFSAVQSEKTFSFFSLKPGRLKHTCF